MSDPNAGLDVEALHAALSASVRRVYGDDARLEGRDAQVLAERRGRRVVRYDLDVGTSERDGPRRVQWIGKFYLDRPEAAPHVAGVLDALSAAGFSEAAEAAIPRVVAHHLALGLLLLDYLPGERILNVLAAEPERVLGRLGRALAELHCLALPMAERKTPATIIASLRRRVELLCAWFPAEAERIQQALARIERTAPDDVARPAPLHNDFGISQLLWHDGCLGILDFDKCALGDPANDLANFVAQRRRDAFEGALTPSVEVVRTLLLDAYRCFSHDADVVAGLTERVAWYEQAVLLGKVHFLARQGNPEKRLQAPPVLGLLEALQTSAS